MYRVAPSSVPSSQAHVIHRSYESDSRDSLTRRQYAFLWMFMVLLHALCSTFLICSAKLYWLMENEYLDYFAGLLASERDRHFRVVGTTLGILGAIHGLQMLCHLKAATFARRLRVRPLNVGSAMETLLKLVVKSFTRLGYRWGLLRNAGRRTGCSHSLRECDQSNEHFTRMFALRKTLEIATQVPNGYLYSTLVARSWINHAKVALIVTNCWSAFIIHQMLLKSDPDGRQVAPPLTKSRTSIRLLAVTVDAALATATAIILPTAIFMPYALQFDVKNLSFPYTMLYGDTAFPNLVLENRAFFFMSWANSTMKFVPHLSVFMCLEAIAAMLHSSDLPDTTTTTKRSLPEPRVVRSSIRRSIIALASYRAFLRASGRVQNSARILFRVHRVTIPMLLLITGGIVLGLHLSSQYGAVTGDVAKMESLCMQRMHPWLASNFSCAVVRYNCYKEGVTSPSVEVLGWLEREAVRKIIFMHCSAFTMPPIIREFSSLMGVELWNATLVDWAEEAAVSAELHPMMLFALFIYVNMTGIPPGILQTPLPIQLTDLEFSHTNLTTIPESVVEPWNGMEIMFIEHSQINPFPSVLMQLPVLSDISLIDNEIETIPDDVFLNGASSYFYSVALSKNPLRKLPQGQNLNFDISYLGLEFTLLTEVPDWITTNVWDAVSLGGSPLCQMKRNVELADNVLCGEDENAWDPLGGERYPIKLVEPFRSLDA
ncbi:hypothetical protein F443_01561 [Phytophthora nicotianae P1569]|uniref:Uncharacterized protein n=2 Tax=Phytophthora nicotianae TaxID=4792 RepID=V9FYE5_PHYNI|nr:hypothetical protein F443_01561 [Phytophthora nicotianae P1569]